MSSFREEAAKMQAAYQEVQENQQELDENTMERKHSLATIDKLAMAWE